MTDNHPITLPQGLITKWIEDEETPLWKQFQEAARWGADQELEACCAWANATGWEGAGDSLRADRRPKPPTLKEQALEALMRADGADHPVPALVLSLDEAVLIRRALEQLDD